MSQDDRIRAKIVLGCVAEEIRVQTDDVDSYYLLKENFYQRDLKFAKGFPFRIIITKMKKKYNFFGGNDKKTVVE